MMFGNRHILVSLQLSTRSWHASLQLCMSCLTRQRPEVEFAANNRNHPHFRSAQYLNSTLPFYIPAMPCNKAIFTTLSPPFVVAYIPLKKSCIHGTGYRHCRTSIVRLCWRQILKNIDYLATTSFFRTSEKMSMYIALFSSMSF
jgi:hypothetical protein